MLAPRPLYLGLIILLFGSTLALPYLEPTYSLQRRAESSTHKETQTQTNLPVEFKAGDMLRARPKHFIPTNGHNNNGMHPVIALTDSSDKSEHVLVAPLSHRHAKGTIIKPVSRYGLSNGQESYVNLQPQLIKHTHLKPYTPPQVGNNDLNSAKLRDTKN